MRASGPGSRRRPARSSRAAATACAEPALAAEQRVPDAHRRQAVGARDQQLAPGAIDERVAALIGRRAPHLERPDPGGRGGLGEDLRVLDVVVTAEHQPRGGKHEQRAAAALGGQRRHAHRPPHARAQARRVDERQLQLRGALRDRPEIAVGAVAGQRDAACRAPPQAGQQAIGALGQQVRVGRGEVEVQGRRDRAATGCRLLRHDRRHRMTALWSEAAMNRGEYPHLLGAPALTRPGPLRRRRAPRPSGSTRRAWRRSATGGARRSSR